MDMFSQARLAYAPNHTETGTAVHRVISEAQFSEAIAEIRSWHGYSATPLHQLPALAAHLKIGEVYYKHEGPRFGLGSFKALGGAYAALRVLQRQLVQQLGHKISLADIRTGKYKDACAKITLTSATDGNHGRSLAWGCQRFGAPCRIYIHAEVSDARKQAMCDLGAEVIRIDGDYDASVAMAREDAKANGWFVVSDTSWEGYSDPPRDVMAGYGVMAREICNTLQTPPTHIFLQGGVGGLAAAMAAALRQHWGANTPRVVIVEPELAACLFASAQHGDVTTVAITKETVMAGLSCGEPSPMAWEILAEEASGFLTIPESIVAPTVRLLAHPLGDDPTIEAGESGIAGLAALVAARQDDNLSSQLGLNSESRVLLIGSEGVTDPEIFEAIMRGRDK